MVHIGEYKKIIIVLQLENITHSYVANQNGHGCNTFNVEIHTSALVTPKVLYKILLWHLEVKLIDCGMDYPSFLYRDTQMWVFEILELSMLCSLVNTNLYEQDHEILPAPSNIFYCKQDYFIYWQFQWKISHLWFLDHVRNLNWATCLVLD